MSRATYSRWTQSVLKGTFVSTAKSPAKSPVFLRGTAPDALRGHVPDSAFLSEAGSEASHPAPPPTGSPLSLQNPEDAAHGDARASWSIDQARKSQWSEAAARVSFPTRVRAGGGEDRQAQVPKADVFVSHWMGASVATFTKMDPIAHH